MGKDKMIAKEIDLNSSESRLDGENADAQSSKRTRYSRHTLHQIHDMEALFKECPHPTNKQMREPCRKLGLKPSHFKFWFQNRRSQMKAPYEHQESIQLRTTNDRLRAENMRYREALCDAGAVCAICGRPLGVEEISREEYQLKSENARLRAEIGLMSRVAEMYIGKRFPPQ